MEPPARRARPGPPPRRRRERPRATPGGRLRLRPGRGEPRPRPSPRGGAPREILRPGDLAPSLPEHALDLERHSQRPKVLGLWQLHLARRFCGARGRDQVADLQLERVVLVDEEALDEGRLPVADRLAVERVFLRGAPVDLDVLIGVVQDDVGVWLGDRQRADLLFRGAARGDGRHGAGIEEDLHVGDVGLARMDGAPEGVHPARLAVDQAEHDVDVVDHEVHHDRVVLHARYEGPQPPGLDQDGPLDDLAQLLHRPVEALHVAHVEHPPTMARHAKELLGLFQRGGHRLFDEHVHARLEQVAGDLEVPLRRNGHRRDVDEPGQLLVGCDGPRPVLRGDLAGPRRIGVADRHELDVPQLRQRENVVLAHVPRAHHAGADASVVRHVYHTRSSLSASAPVVSSSRDAGTIPRLEPSMNSTSRATSGWPPSSALTLEVAAPGPRPDRYRIRKAARTRRRPSASTPPRRMPMTLTPRAVAGEPSAVTNGGTSCVTFEQPPMYAYAPIRVKGWIPVSPPIVARSSTVTCPVRPA